ncbi:hypothetical protein CPB84DRAFT_1762387 [Gymnopilus junonius]|uniref:Uncharacterized protein n=1 Tax=Gymnopilus junonius TaxID=109634 RepID=A0A9P5NZC6_GYMJU|nr:hypothetical protein CPB84DRAFT_1762387 [Gymnopilus junonius]
MSGQQIHSQVNVLLEWCAANCIFIDPHMRIALDVDEDEGGRGCLGVYSTEKFIPPNYTLVRIPKDAVLSVRSCSLSGYIPFSPYGLEAQLALSLALYAEILRETQSRWFGYLQSLPAGLVDLPMFDLNSRSEDGLTTLEEINRFYHDFAEPLLLQHMALWQYGSTTSSIPTLNGFYRAFSLVHRALSSVDAYHGLSMVPIADWENHVHLESDYNVCPECGSLEECPHDAEESSEGRTAPKSKIRMLIMICLRYDFQYIWGRLDERPSCSTSMVSFWTCFYLRMPLKRIKREVFSLFRDILPCLNRDHHVFDQSRLIYYGGPSDRQFYLNDEGSLSHQLWSIFFVTSVHRQQLFPTRVDLRQTLQAVLNHQLTLETSLLGDQDESENAPSHQITFNHPDTRIIEVLLEIGQMSMALCSHLDSELHGLWNAMEEISDNAVRTELALSLLMSERSILDVANRNGEN